VIEEEAILGQKRAGCFTFRGGREGQATLQVKETRAGSSSTHGGQGERNTGRKQNTVLQADRVVSCEILQGRFCKALMTVAWARWSYLNVLISLFRSSALMWLHAAVSAPP